VERWVGIGRIRVSSLKYEMVREESNEDTKIVMPFQREKVKINPFHWMVNAAENSVTLSDNWWWFVRISQR